MNTSLGGRPGNSQTNDFIISAWYSWSMLQHGRGSELWDLHVSYFPLCPSVRNLNQKQDLPKKDDINMSYVLLHIQKLTKGFAWEQHSCWFCDEDTSSGKQCVQRIPFSQTQTLVLHIRGIPAFPQAKDQNHDFPWTTRSPLYLLKELSLYPNVKGKFMTTSIFSHLSDSNIVWHSYCSFITQNTFHPLRLLLFELHLFVLLN